jgi:ribosome modulation factor
VTPQITDEPIYYGAADLDRLEIFVMRSVMDSGYKARVVGLLLKDCPPYTVTKWQRWWRAGWRQRSEEERAKRK